VGVTDTLCTFLILLGLGVQAEYYIIVAKLVLIFMFLAFTSPASLYALANNAWRWGLRHQQKLHVRSLIENDLRKVLAYSLINQLGFMVCGIGIGTALALNGAVAHAFNDVIFKGLLFMTMGAVLTRVGHVNGLDLGGLNLDMNIYGYCCCLRRLVCFIMRASKFHFLRFSPTIQGCGQKKRRLTCSSPWAFHRCYVLLHANAATLTYRMVIGFIVLAVIAFITELMSTI
jgi:hypothetical protein